MPCFNRVSHWAALAGAVLLANLLACSPPEPAAESSPPEVIYVVRKPTQPQSRPAGGGEKTVTGGEAYHGLIEYRARDAKKAIIKPVLMQADRVQLAGGLSVVGVAHQGEARAYPLYILKNHQVVNDKFGGLPIAASW